MGRIILLCLLTLTAYCQQPYCLDSLEQKNLAIFITESYQKDTTIIIQDSMIVSQGSELIKSNELIDNLTEQLKYYQALPKTIEIIEQGFTLLEVLGMICPAIALAYFIGRLN